jgi:indolepyruvate ferredoxin oxidoreductase
MFKGLVKAKRARGTKFDPFGRTDERRIERALVDEYPVLVDRVLSHLDAGNADEARGVLHLADQIRGFNSVKLANVASYRAQVTVALEVYEREAQQS